jgi:hypothetical protein
MGEVEASGPFDEAVVGRDALLTALRGRVQAKPHLSFGRKREIKGWGHFGVVSNQRNRLSKKMLA